MSDKSDYAAIRYVYTGIKGQKFPVEFKDFADFFEWSKESGWDYGKRLRRLDQSKGYSRENCIWMDTEKTYKFDETNKLARQWDEFVNRVRENLKNLPPYDPVKQQRNGREFFRYEHPDLEREGIVWQQTSQD